MIKIRKCAILVCAILFQALVFISCSNDKEKADEARMNALITARLGDIMKGDYKNALTLIESKGMYVKTDIFGNEHVFKQGEKALSYIASVNNATFDVMDSLALSVEEAALAQPDNGNMKKINALVKNYVTLCKNPNSAGNKLIEQCESISADITKAVEADGVPEQEKLQMQLALAGNAIMQKEMKAAQLAAERDQEAAKRFKAEGEAFLEKNAKAKGVVSLPSGLQYRIIKNGTGKRPDDGSQVTVTYEGRFIDGKVFDSTDKGNGGKPVTLSMGSVVRGWNEALKLMAEGSEWEIYLPYELGYGEEGSDGVPPCSALIFRLKLIDVK